MDQVLDQAPINWNLVYDETMEAGCISEIYNCYNPLNSKTDKKLYVIKILTRKNSCDAINLRTIELQTELGKLSIMPEIIDQGICSAEEVIQSHLNVDSLL